jgi:hypothetical protein
MKSFLVGLKNVLLWSYRRGSWQYDLLCLLIVAVVFLIPGRFFGDRDRPHSIPQANSGPVSASQLEAGTSQWEIEADDLRSFLREQNKAELINSPQEAIVLYLSDRLKREVRLARPPEVFSDAQGRVGYRVWYKKDKR